MTLNDFDYKEMYVFLKKLEERGISSEKAFLIATFKNKITIEVFLTILQKYGFCSKYFISEYFKVFHDKNKIHFYDDLLFFIMKNEMFDEEISKECVRMLFAKFLSANFSFKKDYLIEIIGYAQKLNLDGARNYEESLMPFSPLLYVSIGEVSAIPKYLIDYSLFIEFEEESRAFEGHKEIAYSLSKRDELIELTDALEVLSDDFGKEIIKKLKKSLGV